MYFAALNSFSFFYFRCNLAIGSRYTYEAHRLTYPSARHKKRIDSGKLCEVVFIVSAVYLALEFQNPVMPKKPAYNSMIYKLFKKNCIMKYKPLSNIYKIYKH